MCRSEHRKQQKVKEITEPDDSEKSDTDKSISSKTVMKHITDQKYHNAMTVKTDGAETEFILDTRSAVTLIPPDEALLKNKKISPLTRKYLDVNENEVKFAGNTTVEAESRRIRKDFTMFSTEQEDIKPLLGMAWLRDLKWTMRNIESTMTTTDHSEKNKLIANFEKIFKTSGTIKDTELETQLNPGHPPIKQKARPIPYHIQGYNKKNKQTNSTCTLSKKK